MRIVLGYCLLTGITGIQFRKSITPLFLLMVMTCCSQIETRKSYLYGVNEKNFFIRGTGLIRKDTILLEWSGSGIGFNTTSTELTFLLEDISHGQDDYGNPLHGYYGVLENGKLVSTFQSQPDMKEYRIAGLKTGSKEIELLRLNEPMVSQTRFTGIKLSGEEQIGTTTDKTSPNLLVIGNSITTGYGNNSEDTPCHFSPDTQDFTNSYIYQAAKELEMNLTVRAWSGKGLVRNYDKSTSVTMRDLYHYFLPYNRTESYSNSEIYDLAVIHLGTNDFAHSIPDRNQWTTAYFTFLTELSENYGVSKFILLGGPTLKNREGYPAFQMLELYLEDIANRAEVHGLSVKTTLYSAIEGSGSGCDAHPDANAHQQMAHQLVNFIQSNWPDLTKKG